MDLNLSIKELTNKIFVKNLPMDDARNKIVMPLPPFLVKYIKYEYPELSQVIMSAIEVAIKDSNNHYHDVMCALEPFLRDKTKAFVDKLFMFRKKLCRDGFNCHKEFCLFAHDENEIIGVKRGAMDNDIMKKLKTDNCEVVYNKVDESKYTIEDLSKHANKFGTVLNIRRLNRGKYLVVFRSNEEAKMLVESNDYVFNNPDIKKFFNINLQNSSLGNNSKDSPNSNSIFTKNTGFSNGNFENSYKESFSRDSNMNQYVPVNTLNTKNNAETTSKEDIRALLDEQKYILDNLSISSDSLNLISLKSITARIRNYILNGDLNNFEPQEDEHDIEANIETSMYYNMFAE